METNKLSLSIDDINKLKTSEKQCIIGRFDISHFTFDCSRMHLYNNENKYTLFVNINQSFDKSQIKSIRQLLQPTLDLINANLKIDSITSFEKDLIDNNLLKFNFKDLQHCKKVFLHIFDKKLKLNDLQECNLTYPKKVCVYFIPQITVFKDKVHITLKLRSVYVHNTKIQKAISYTNYIKSKSPKISENFTGYSSKTNTLVNNVMQYVKNKNIS